MRWIPNAKIVMFVNLTILVADVSVGGCYTGLVNMRLLKVVPATFLLVCFLSLKESTCETRTNVFVSLQKLFSFSKNQILEFLIFKFHGIMKCLSIKPQIHLSKKLKFGYLTMHIVQPYCTSFKGVIGRRWIFYLAHCWIFLVIGKNMMAVLHLLAIIFYFVVWNT